MSNKETTREEFGLSPEAIAENKRPEVIRDRFFAAALQGILAHGQYEIDGQLVGINQAIPLAAFVARQSMEFFEYPQPELPEAPVKPEAPTNYDARVAVRQFGPRYTSYSRACMKADLDALSLEQFAKAGGYDPRLAAKQAIHPADGGGT